MIPLNDTRWAMLTDCYGSAVEIPALLSQAANFPPDDEPNAEPYFSLWSALCHQGDVYPASYAAVPHLVAMLESNPLKAHWSILLLIVSIEIARFQQRGPLLAGELSLPYKTALVRLPSAVAAMSGQQWDESFTRIAASAIAASRGQAALAEAIMELEPEMVPTFMTMVFDQ
jgi:hypothetical protein